MTPPASEQTLELQPQSRLDVINISRRLGDSLSAYPKALYYSYHTTAGYLDPRICARLKHDSANVQAFLESFQTLFPEGAGYRHDDLEHREELTEEQKKGEPRNADAHLTFIGSGLSNCVTYRNDPGVPVFFIDLDGVNGSVPRVRQTTIIGFSREESAGHVRFEIPVSRHPVDSVNLKNRQLGFFEALDAHIRAEGITRGRIDIFLDREEMNAGLTVNEYETFLMRNDLAEVLRYPFRYMADRGRHMISDPKAIPSKAKGYAKYDFVQVLNEFFDAVGLSETLFERVVHRFLAVPASRFLRVKRSVSLLINDCGDGRSPIVGGQYQSPILVQWRRTESHCRHMRANLIRFE